MSTIKSSDEHLTLNADGSSKDIKFQANGVEKASISSAGAFTSTTIDATKLTGNLPAISGAALTGLSSFDPDGAVTINDSGADVDFRVESDNDANALFVQGSDGKVGIRQNAPPAMLSLGQDSGSADSAACSGIAFKTSDDDDMFQISTVGGANNDARGLKFNGDGTERIRMTASGRLGVATDSPSYNIEVGDTNSKGWSINLNNNVANMRMRASATDTQTHIDFINPNAYVGSIKTNGSATSFNTSSDYRLKENVDYTWDATTRLKQLKPARFNFIADDTNTLVDGFIAHEVSSVVPEAISGEKDAVDANGDIDPQGIDQSKLVPLLVKTIQELEARITALEG